MARKRKRYYWLKLKTDFFQSDDIKLILSQKDGAEYVVFWLKLLLKAIEAEEPGILKYRDKIPYTAEMLASITDTNVSVVRSAMMLFQKLGMIEIKEDGEIWIEEATRLIGSESESAERVRRYRARQKLKALQCNANVTQCNECNAQCNREIEYRDRDRDREYIRTYIGNRDNNDNKNDSSNRDYKNKTNNKVGSYEPTCPQNKFEDDTEKGKPSFSESSHSKCPHKEIIKLYHEILPELPRVRVWNNTRQRYLQARWREDPERQNLDWWRGFFNLVRKCPFLMGQVPTRNGQIFQADLEWLIRPTNFAKVLEGRYLRKDLEGRVSSVTIHNLKAAQEFLKMEEEDKNEES